MREEGPRGAEQRLGLCWPRAFRSWHGLEPGSALAAPKGASTQKTGCPWPGHRLSIREPAFLATCFKGLREPGDLGPGERCCGHSHLQNYVGSGGLPLTFKKSSRRQQTGLAFSLCVLCADGRWHLSVKLRTMSSPGPAKRSCVCQSCSLPCDV